MVNYTLYTLNSTWLWAGEMSSSHHPPCTMVAKPFLKSHLWLHLECQETQSFLGWKISRDIVGGIQIQMVWLYKEFFPIATWFWVPLIDTSYCLSHVMSRGAASIIRLEPVQSNCQCNQIRGFSLLKVESKDTLLSIEVFFYCGRVTIIEIFEKNLV